MTGIRGFQAGETVQIYFDSANTSTVVAGTKGFPPTGVGIPTRAVPGRHWVTAVGQKSGVTVQRAVTVTGDWRDGGQDPTRQGFNRFENLLSRQTVSSAVQRWRAVAGGGFGASPSVAFDILSGENRLFAGAADGNLYVFNADCSSTVCKPLWTAQTDGAIDTSPAIAGGVVYVGSTDGSLYAFKVSGCGAPTCLPTWIGRTGDSIHSSPMVSGGRVFVGSDDGALYAFDAAGCGSATCLPAWTGPTGGPVRSSPSAGFEPKQLGGVVSHGRELVFVGSDDGSLYAFDEAGCGSPTCAAVWSRPTGGRIRSAPAFAPHVRARMALVYATSEDGRLYAVNAANGSVLWMSSGITAPTITTAPAVALSRVYVTADTTLYAFNADGRGCSQCAPVWRGTLPAPVRSSPSVANGVVYVGASDGSIHGFNAAGCRRLDGVCATPLWSSKADSAEILATPVVVNGLVYRASADGSLEAMGSREAPIPPPAPDPALLKPLPTPIRHVVVLFQENHSFNEVLGALCLETTPPRCEAVTTGVLSDGSVVELSDAPDIVPPVGHGSEDQATAINGGAMNLFDKIRGCARSKGLKCYVQYKEPDQDIPSLAALARSFAISDRTFATFPVGTWGIHNALVTGSLSGFTGDFPKVNGDYPAWGDEPGPGWGCDSLKAAPWKSSPEASIQYVPSCIPASDGSGPYKPSPVEQSPPTIMDRVEQAGLSWKIYQGAQLYSNGSVWATCPSFGDCLYGTQSANLTPAAGVLSDARAGTLPNLSLVMPLPDGHSQHNGLSMMMGDNWISMALQAIMNGPDWKSTAVFITYDDCGCFYDHVPPPAGMGPRLPMVIVSPYARRGFTDSNTASLASVLAYAREAFRLQAVTALDGTSYGYANSFDYTQAPLKPIPLQRHTLPQSSVRWLEVFPGPQMDPE